MKIPVTLLLGLLAITMNGQAKKVNEVHTRPISLLQGVATVGLEMQTGDKTSILFDGGYGQSALDAFISDRNRVTTFMIGGRRYLNSANDQLRREYLKIGDKQALEGAYVTLRHRSRFYESGGYGANTNFMVGKKYLQGSLSFAVEFGVGRQTQSAISLILPTWAVTIGLRSK